MMSNGADDLTIQNDAQTRESDKVEVGGKASKDGEGRVGVAHDGNDGGIWMGMDANGDVSTSYQAKRTKWRSEPAPLIKWPEPPSSLASGWK